MRVAVVGLDHYHVTGWVETVRLFPDDLEIVALFDPDPALGKALAPRFWDPSLPAALPRGFDTLPFETDLGRLIERHRIDVALVTMPDRDAPEAIERLARAGVHMVVDKPAATSAAAARRAFGTAREAGVRVVVGLTRRYSPAARAVRDMVAAGRLGRLVTAEATFAASSVPVRDPANHLFDASRSAGGILAWLGIHDLDALPWLVGEPVVEVSAVTARRGDAGLAVEDVASVTLRFAGGALGVLHHAYALPARGYRGHLALRGLDASIELGPGERLTTLLPAADGLQEETVEFDDPDVPGYGATGRAAVADLLGAIRDGRETEAPGDFLVAAHELLDAAYRSAREGRLIRLSR
jgi:UDP-N-acetyl-2-amino-2-deoxyglucuronate dehydrogenase